VDWLTSGGMLAGSLTDIWREEKGGGVLGEADGVKKEVDCVMEAWILFTFWLTWAQKNRKARQQSISCYDNRQDNSPPRCPASQC
jgi:hypothetical protein